MVCSAVARQRPLWRVVGWRGKGGNGEQIEGWIRLGKGAVETVAGANGLERNPANGLGRGGAGKASPNGLYCRLGH